MLRHVAGFVSMILGSTIPLIRSCLESRKTVPFQMQGVEAKWAVPLSSTLPGDSLHIRPGSTHPIGTVVYRAKTLSFRGILTRVLVPRLILPFWSKNNISLCLCWGVPEQITGVVLGIDLGHEKLSKLNGTKDC